MGKECSNIWCKKMKPNGEGYCCQQDEKNYCGCFSAINFSPLEDLLSSEQKEARNARIKKIRIAIQNKHAALVLGAGISRPCNMPLWTDLVSKMMGYALQYAVVGQGSHHFKMLEEEDRARIQRFSDQLMRGSLAMLGNVNALESAEYVAQFFDDPSLGPLFRKRIPEISIRAMIRQILDKTFSPADLMKKEYDAEDSPSFLAKIREKVNSGISLPEAIRSKEKDIASLNTLFAISYLMANDNGIHQAMTYNFDPLVQEHLLNLFGIDETLIRTHPGKWGNGHEIRTENLRELFHVHGFVSGNRQDILNIENVFPAESGPLVLSEDSYYRIEREEAYNWSSSIQSFFLNKYNCVFVGFSAEDFNFRRILRQIGEKENPSENIHYLILTVDDWIRHVYEDLCHTVFNERGLADKGVLDELSTNATLLLQCLLKSREDYWRRFQIKPIWVTVNEIPALLTSLI